MPPFVRQTRFGFPLPGQPSESQLTGFVPLPGFTPSDPELLSTPGSLISAQNVFIHENALQPRWKLSASSLSAPTSIASMGGNITNPSSDGSVILGSAVFRGKRILNGALVTATLFDSTVPVVIVHQTGASSSTILFGYANTGAQGLQWGKLSYTSSTGSTLWPPSISTQRQMRGVMVYDAATDKDLLVLGSFASCSYVWDGSTNTTSADGSPTVGTGFSHMTGAPSCYDLCNFRDRVVMWSCGTILNGSPIGNRVQWNAEGSAYDWTGIGAGTQDLVDMPGVGTRIFATEDQMILATDKQLWRGRFVGLPYVFDFTPLDRQHGIPYPRAALQTPSGIFWIDRDYMLYRLTGEVAQPIGAKVQHYLRDRMPQGCLDTTWLSYNRTLNHLRLWWSTTTGSYPDRTLTFDVENGTIVPDVYGVVVQHVLSEPLGRLTAQGLAGGYADPQLEELVFTSAGSAAHLRSSAASDLGAVCEEDAVFAPVNPGSVQRMNFLQESRFDMAARSASSVTVSWSTDFAKTTSGTPTQLNVSASSNALQYRQFPNVTTQYATLRLQSTGGGWQLRKVAVQSKDAGLAMP